MIRNSGDKVTWLGVGFYALRIFIFIQGLLQLVGLMGTKIDINVNQLRRAIKQIAFPKDKLYSVKRMRVNKHASA
jgi:hypothetical protein